MAQIGTETPKSKATWHKPSCPCFSNFYAKCGCGYWSNDKKNWELAEDYERVRDLVGAKQSENCGCWYSHEEGLPCEHDLALLAEKLAVPG